MTLIDKRIAEIEEREKEATKGPWWCHRLNISEFDSVFEEATFKNWNGDGKFIGHSREDIPWLLSQLKLHREAVKELRTVLVEYRQGTAFKFHRQNRGVNEFDFHNSTILARDAIYETDQLIGEPKEGA